MHVQLNQYHDLAKAILDDDLDEVKNFCGEGQICNIKGGYESENALHRAIRLQRHEIAKYILTLPRVNVNVRKSQNLSALHLAVENNDLEMVKLLSSAEGIDINACGGHLKLETPLHWAAMNKYSEIVEYLVSLPGIKVNAATPSRLGSYTPLYWAVKNNDIVSVKALCSHHDVDPNLRFGELAGTALHLAVKLNLVEIIEILCSAPGIDVNFSSLGRGITPLRQATDLNHFEAVKVLCKAPGIDCDIKEIEGMPAYVRWNEYHDLTKAILNDDLNGVKKYCGEGQVCNIKGGDKSENALHRAIRLQRHEIVKYILTLSRVNVNIRNAENLSSLHFAVEHNDIVSVKAICSRQDVNPNLKSANLEETPLHLAVKSNFVEIIKILCSAPGINVNVQSNKGMTPLRLATDLNHFEAVKILCNIPGINWNVKDIESMPACGPWNKYYDLAKAILDDDLDGVKNYCGEGQVCNIKGGDKSENALHIAIRMKRHEIAKYILTLSKVDVNIRNAKNLSALHLAVKSNNIGLVKILCSRQDLKSARLRETPLHLAVRINSLETIKILCLAPGIDVNDQSLKKGMTPLRLAADLNHFEAMMFLCDIPGIILDIKDNEGMPAKLLHRAVQNEDLEAVKFLCSKDEIDPNVTRSRVLKKVRSSVGDYSLLYMCSILVILFASVALCVWLLVCGLERFTSIFADADDPDYKRLPDNLFILFIVSVVTLVIGCLLPLIRFLDKFIKSMIEDDGIEDNIMIEVNHVMTMDLESIYDHDDITALELAILMKRYEIVTFLREVPNIIQNCIAFMFRKEER